MVNKLLSPKDRVYLDPFQMGFVWLIINGIDSITTYPIPDNGPPSRRAHRPPCRTAWGCWKGDASQKLLGLSKNRGTPVVGWFIIMENPIS